MRPEVSTTIKSGALKGLRTVIMLLKIVIPVYLIVALVGYTGVYLWLAGHVEPVMRIFGLPSEAVVPIFTGIFTDEYSVVAVMSRFPFTVAHITIIALITLCLHSIPLEVVITRKIGLSAWKIGLFRCFLAVGTGILAAYLASVFIGGTPPAFSSAPEAIAGAAAGAGAGAGIADAGGLTLHFDWAVILPEIGLGALRTAITITSVVIPLMIGIEFLLAYKIVHLLAKKLSPFCRLLGIGQDALLPLLVGFLLGVSYGAGAIVELNRMKPLPAGDLRLVGIFLFSCHGIIETTYLFALAGGSVIFMCVLRLAIAVVVTAMAARFGRFLCRGKNPAGKKIEILSK